MAPSRPIQNLLASLTLALLLVTTFCCAPARAQYEEMIEQTLSDDAQLNTLSFAALAFLTGDMCRDTMFPPGKMADYFGFQTLRDNDSDEQGHSGDFLTDIANNVLYILNDEQVAQLIALAEEQEEQIEEYAYDRLPLIAAFRQVFEGDTRLNNTAVQYYSSMLYNLGAQISIARAKVFLDILSSMTQTQIDYFDMLASDGSLSWPDVGDQINKEDYSHNVHSAVLTYAGQIFSWYKGDVDADVYFCPERQGTYFGAFYIKTMSTGGDSSELIDPNLTANMGTAFLEVLDDTQYAQISSLVDEQRDALYGIVDARRNIATMLRSCSEESCEEEAILHQADNYGALDAEIVYAYAMRFSLVGDTLTGSQQSELDALAAQDENPCEGCYIYSENISMPEVNGVEYFFTLVYTAPLAPPLAVLGFGMLLAGAGARLAARRKRR